MPNAKTHIWIGVISSFLIICALIYFNILKLDLKISLISLPVIWLYSQLPDIDHKMSRIRFYFYLVWIIIFGLTIYYKLYPGIIVLIILFVLVLFMKHRGMMHKYLIGLFFSCIFFFNIQLFLVAFISYTSHILADKIKGEK